MGRKSRRKGKQGSTDSSRALRAESSPTRLVTIGERLELPAYRAEEEAEEEEEEEEELQLEFRPRLYFAASLCYLCGAGFGPEEREPCPGCQLVAYCSEEHRLRDRPQHGQLCGVLAELGQALRVAARLGPDQFRQLRLRLLQLAEEALARRLEPREREPLLYPRLCAACHCAEALAECPDCRMELYCPEHRARHLPHCAELRLFRGLLLAQRQAGSVAPPIPRGYPAPGQPLPASFDLLVREAFGPGPRYLRVDAASYAALSQVASPALTAAAAALAHLHHRINRNLLTIHVIGAELQFECANVAVWEKLFLHFLPGVKCLRLEFCGPELQVPPDIASLLERPRLCSSCRADNRKIDIVFHCGKLYHELDNAKPDLICLFNPGLYRTTGFANQDTWPQTIEKFCDYGSPILVTSYTEVELPRDLARIREFRKLQVEQEPRRNPFASLKPERNFVSDDVAPLIYKNYFYSVARGIIDGHAN